MYRAYDIEVSIAFTRSSQQVQRDDITIAGSGVLKGLAFDVDGNLYVAASLAGRRGVVKITPAGKASLGVAGDQIVGLAFAPGRSAVLATTGAVHRISWDIQGLRVLVK